MAAIWAMSPPTQFEGSRRRYPSRMTVDPGPKLVVFDFDGCVVDSTRVAIECHVEAFRHVGLEVPPEVIADSIQGTYDETIASLSASVPEVAALREDKLRAELAAKKNSELLQQRESAPVFSLVPYLLRRLKKDGRRIGILSRSGNGRIKSILREFNLSTFFEPNLIVSGDNDLVIQPKPSQVKV